ncbi:MAG: CoA-binding protein [Flavobacteriales bacterium]|nr:MAG: CoA-binding protein [Flavobacteriales bacterium]
MPDGPKTTLVLGASPRADRYSNMAVRSLRDHGHPVLAVGARAASIDDLPIHVTIPGNTEVHTVTLYLNASNQAVWEDRIIALKPRRIIFNPGAENERLFRRALAHGIEPLEACTLVLLATGQF